MIDVAVDNMGLEGLQGGELYARSQGATGWEGGGGGDTRPHACRSSQIVGLAPKHYRDRVICGLFAGPGCVSQD